MRIPTCTRWVRCCTTCSLGTCRTCRRGAVRGVARSILMHALPELVEADVAGEDLRAADELIAVNAVRGAHPIVALDGLPIAGGNPGPWAAQLALLLDANA